MDLFSQEIDDEPSGKQRWCRGCRQNRPLETFSVARNKPDGINHHCRDCNMAWMRKKRGVGTRWLKLRPTDDDACATCSRKNEGNRPLFLDHDHKTGEFRGWLCSACNSAIGLAKDNPDLLRRLADYLESAASTT